VAMTSLPSSMVEAPASRSSLTSRSWATPLARSTLPLAWGECATVIVIPREAQTFPNAVSGRTP